MARGHVRQLPFSVGHQVPERRTFGRRQTSVDAVLQVHDRFQQITIHNVSRGGMQLKDAFGLMPGDVITVELLSRRTFDGTVAWSVAPYTGIAFDQPLADDDPMLADDELI
jgi:hypothetical protein